MVIRSPSVPGSAESPGCRDAALATIFLLGFAAALFATGLALINQDECTAACETIGLTTLYAGGPVSAVFGVLTDSVVIAWPLDVTLWVVLGFTVAGISARRGVSVFPVALLVIVPACAALVVYRKHSTRGPHHAAK